MMVSLSLTRNNFARRVTVKIKTFKKSAATLLKDMPQRATDTKIQIPQLLLQYIRGATYTRNESANAVHYVGTTVRFHDNIKVHNNSLIVFRIPRLSHLLKETDAAITRWTIRSRRQITISDQTIGSIKNQNFLKQELDVGSVMAVCNKTKPVTVSP